MVRDDIDTCVNKKSIYMPVLGAMAGLYAVGCPAPVSDSIRVLQREGEGGLLSYSALVDDYRDTRMLGADSVPRLDHKRTCKCTSQAEVWWQ